MDWKGLVLVRPPKLLRSTGLGWFMSFFLRQRGQDQLYRVENLFRRTLLDGLADFPSMVLIALQPGDAYLGKRGTRWPDSGFVGASRRSEMSTTSDSSVSDIRRTRLSGRYIGKPEQRNTDGGMIFDLSFSSPGKGGPAVAHVRCRLTYSLRFADPESSCGECPAIEPTCTCVNEDSILFSSHQKEYLRCPENVKTTGLQTSRTLEGKSYT
ncbi:uncharacterized protein CLUP02_00751 [Colletotrichum lupini]|uniref:Uncharacterized protein n=1 Tax=Colletotrichum lupini TaxID=145971 RepID=A0A9Q8SB09_9PEZI|nr:uncharacterized protein CLUP02_00751 [Colletotrichum lupini]UQC74104.1 hypothetical protein CLUP02_00751 [Colletotrichum lupini]